MMSKLLFTNVSSEKRLHLLKRCHRKLGFLSLNANLKQSPTKELVLIQSSKLSTKTNEQLFKKYVNMLASLKLITNRNVLKGGPGYTKFGHGRQKPEISKFAYFYYSLLLGGITFAVFFDFESFLFKGLEPRQKLEDINNIYNISHKPKAKEISKENEDDDNERSDNDDAVTTTDESQGELDESDDGSTVSTKKKTSFRNRKIIQYENRIRQYSTPDKIFRYFATLKVWNEKLDDYEIFMTPEDFVRSLTFGIKQPEGLGLDSFNKFDPKMQKLELNLSDECVFKHLSSDGLISFSDYLFLVTLLSTPTRHFEIAFHMFDLDGNGNIDIDEFEQLQQIIRSQTSSGQRHRDTHMTGSVIKGNSVLNEYFFGKKLDELLTVQKFTEFQKKLQSEVVKMEFNYCNLITRKDGVKVISEESFCEMILAYAGLPGSKTKKMLKKIKQSYNSNEESPGITLEEFERFFQVLRSMHDIDTALKFYTIAGASIDKAILKHVAKTVAEVDLSDHVIEVIFKLFDENGDGKLSQKEFIKVMKRRLLRGLQMPKDTGFIKFINSVTSCTKEIFLAKS